MASALKNLVMRCNPLRVLRIREPVPMWLAVFLGAATVAVILLLWFAVTSGAPEKRMISPLILPSPGEVLSAYPTLHREKGLMRGILVSLARVTGGFLIAALVAIPLGIAMGAFTKVRALANPIAIVGGYIPVAALVPITIAIYGDERQKILFLTIAIFVGLLPLIVRAVDRVDDIYLQTAYTLGATRWQAVTRVLVPVAKCDIYAALRLVYGIGWGYIILAEVVDAKYGIGFMMSTSQRRGQMDEVYAALLVIVAVAITIDFGFKKLGRLLFPYVQE
ncbi:MAG: ABC transporter permease [Planctomycetota bacterium]|nr:ABC transporter permease [Planctomycetota bacterium]